MVHGSNGRVWGYPLPPSVSTHFHSGPWVGLRPCDRPELRMFPSISAPSAAIGRVTGVQSKSAVLRAWGAQEPAAPQPVGPRICLMSTRPGGAAAGRGELPLEPPLRFLMGLPYRMNPLKGDFSKLHLCPGPGAPSTGQHRSWGRTKQTQMTKNPPRAAGLTGARTGRLTRPALCLRPLLFSSLPARVTLEALPGGVPKRSASRMPVELGEDPFPVSGGSIQPLPRRDMRTHRSVPCSGSGVTVPLGLCAL